MQNQKELQEDLLNRRFAGVLPHIDLAGTDFTIDCRVKELREKGAPWNRIEFNSMEVSGSGEGYLFLFDALNSEQYHLDPNLNSLPENVLLLEIPDEIILDPVAFAREYNLDMLDFISEHPIKKDLAAIVRPLTDTRLPEIIQKNLDKQNRGLTKGDFNAKEDPPKLGPTR